MRILLVEDELDLQSVTQRRLIQEGYSVDVASDGEEATDFLFVGEYDCIILDIMLPKKDGLSVLSDLRAKQNISPVLLLTARDSIADRVRGLDAGADDYLIKPFSFDELLARVRSMMRRQSEQKNTVLQFDDLEINTLTREVIRNGNSIDLTAKEYALLEYFLRNPNRILTRAQITEHIWNFDFDCDSNIVDVYVRYLRRKIDLPGSKKLIHTIRGSGYILKDE